VNRLIVGQSAIGLMRWVTNFPRRTRGFISLVIDLAACLACVWLAFSIRLGSWDLVSPAVGIVVLAAVPSWLFASQWLGIYRSIIRTAGLRALLDLTLAVALYALPMIVLFMFIGVANIPRTIGILQPLLFLLVLMISRMAIRYIVIEVLQRRDSENDIRRVAIYGAGRAGQQLGATLRQDGHLVLVGYIDDNVGLAGHRIDGVRIYEGQDIDQLVENLELDEILLAMPSVGRAKRLEIVERLASLDVSVRSLPSLSRLIDGRVSVNDLRKVELDELLCRDAVPPDEVLLSGAITGRSVLVTGAGGSIGSELARQIALRRPSKLVLAERSEFALYSILSEIEALGLDASIEIFAELVDVSDRRAIGRVMDKHRPQSVFHAAAYKHVPLVERNPISGLANNILGTLYCCEEAERVGALRFILISTDKAVRPTNIMGASKRICEIILQARSRLGSGTVFSMVRFGNVLGSSGSVVPKFKEQIEAGGPITLTHRNITRFFMTIPEAAQLVMQAGAMAEGGEVFVLDMGEPIRIYDLACMMVRLSGCTLRDGDNPNGDISIEEVGLRPGEKMYEELLIGDNPEPTRHDRILRAQETSLAWDELSQLLGVLTEALRVGDVEAAVAVVRRCVPDYTDPMSKNAVEFARRNRAASA
jgi:FlaA1/EpsC-like NDP-sugar epimerase